MPLRAPRRHRAALRLSCAAPIFALAALFALPAAASDTLFWPSPWAPGQTWRYRTELLDADTTPGGVDEQRITGISTLRIERMQDPDDGDGLLQVWTSADSRVEVVRGDRAVADALASVIDDLDKIAVELRLDRRGRVAGVRNLAQVRPQVRAAMDRVLDDTVEAMIGAENPDLGEAERDMVRAMVRPMMAAEMDALVDETSVYAMLAADLEDFNAFTGTGYRIGLEARGTDRLYMPISGQPLPTLRMYRADPDPDQPGTAGITWTTTLDADAAGDAALWTLAAEIAGEPALEGSTGRPIGLEYVEEGRIDWRPADGAILRMRIERRQRYGREHQSTSRLAYTLIDAPAGVTAAPQADSTQADSLRPDSTRSDSAQPDPSP